LKIRLNAQGHLIIGYTDDSSADTAPIRFVPQNESHKLGIRFKVAEWPCGSRAFLDSDGTLSLKSHDPKLPEISLVLACGDVAAWMSNGNSCGPEFFFQEKPTSSGAVVMNALIEFMNRL